MLPDAHGALSDAPVFAGPPDAVFNNVSDALPGYQKIDYRENVIESFLANIRQRQLQSGAARLTCRYFSRGPEFVRTEGYHDPLAYSRKTRCNWLPSSRDWTMIALHKAISSLDSSKTFYMRLNYRLYFVSEP